MSADLFTPLDPIAVGASVPGSDTRRLEAEAGTVSEALARVDGVGPVVLSIARAAIAQALGVPSSADASARWLQAPAASFVTLRQAGELRGCIGTLEAHRALLEDLEVNALGAAFRDPRFAPLARRELDDTRVEISILSELEPLDFAGEAELLAQLRPHVDGLVLRHGTQRATFLPQVWEQLPEPATFVAELKRKAGLAERYWSARIRVSRYTVAKFQEPPGRT